MIFNWNRWKRVCKINIAFNRIHKNSIYSFEAGFFLNNRDNDFALLCSRCTWLVHTPRSSSFELRFNCYNHKILLRRDNVSVNIQVNLITCELVTNLNKSNLGISSTFEELQRYDTTKKVLCLRWNEYHLSVYFGELMTQF